MKKHVVWVFLWALAAPCARPEVRTGVLLPDGSEYVSWEVPVQFSRTYYVDNRNPKASDQNPGSKELPFRTVNRAAQVLQPGERVVIMAGVYRERVSPARGGTGPDKIISYEAAPGAHVVLKGSRLVKTGWQPSSGFRLSRGDAGERAAAQSAPKIYEFDLEQLDLGGYNPFAMVNVLEDRGATTNIGAPPQGLKPYLSRRGMVFVDGKRMEQVELYRELAAQDGAFWCEHNGMAVHLRLPGDADPADHEVELVTQEQVFAPRRRHLGYIRIKGITFEHAASGFPISQRGLVSANRGHHWIIEHCTIRQANSVGVDIGNETWNADRAELTGYAIVRRNHISDAGICGLAGIGVQNTLVEDNTFENIGWQDAEPMWESAAIKLHLTRNCLLRNNIIRHLRFAPGIWLDSGNVNSRVTRNVVADVAETVQGGIFLEASHETDMIDHNIIWKVTMGRLNSATEGLRRVGGFGVIITHSDEAIVAHNLIGDCEGAAVAMQTQEARIAGGRGGTSRCHRILNNVFVNNGKSIEFPHRENTAEGNVYSGVARGRGLNWISSPAPAIRVDLPAWQKYFGFDKTGAVADVVFDMDPDRLQLTWKSTADYPEVEALTWFKEDYHGVGVGAKRKPGPFAATPKSGQHVLLDLRGKAASD